MKSLKEIEWTKEISKNCPIIAVLAMLIIGLSIVILFLI